MDTVIVTLASPLTIDGEQVTKLDFTREPIGVDLGRFTSMDLYEGNVKALAHVVPKIARPHVSREVVRNMTSGNLTALALGFAAFLEGVDLDQMAKLVDLAETVASQTGSTAAKTSNSSDRKT